MVSQLKLNWTKFQSECFSVVRHTSIIIILFTARVSGTTLCYTRFAVSLSHARVHFFLSTIRRLGCKWAIHFHIVLQITFIRLMMRLPFLLLFRIGFDCLFKLVYSGAHHREFRRSIFQKSWPNIVVAPNKQYVMWGRSGWKNIAIGQERAVKWRSVQGSMTATHIQWSCTLHLLFTISYAYWMC